MSSMRLRSLFSRNTNKGTSAAADQTRVPDANPGEPPREVELPQEIVKSLQLHLQTVGRAKGRNLDANGFDPDLDLYETGYLDSLGVSEFLVLVEKQYGMALPDSLIGGRANTLTKLAAHIAGALTGK